MSKGQEQDQALSVLLTLREEHSESVTPDIVRRVYEIQKSYQFDDDPNKSLNATRKLIEDLVGTKLKSDGEE